MPQLLIVLGAVLALAGLGGIAAGAPSWALGMGLGSTLIQSGTISFVGGLILVGMSLLLRSVQELAQRIEMVSRAQAATGRQLPPPVHDEHPMPSPQGREFAREPRQEIPVREPAHDPRDPRDPRAPKRPRREPPPVAAQHDERYSHDDRYAQEERRMPPPERRAPPQQGERRVPSMQMHQEEWGAPPADPYAQTMAPPPPQRGRPQEPPMADPRGAPAVPTVVRSGIIGGMAYTLYSDGSIEAELPIGTVRFDSIQELQEHVSNTGMDADMQFNEPAR